MNKYIVLTEINVYGTPDDPKTDENLVFIKPEDILEIKPFGSGSILTLNSDQPYVIVAEPKDEIEKLMQA